MRRRSFILAALVLGGGVVFSGRPAAEAAVKTCPTCKGSRWVGQGDMKKPCVTCDGEGTVTDNFGGGGGSNDRGKKGSGGC